MLERGMPRSARMERELLDRIDALAAGRFRGNVPPPVAERIAAEKRHIFGNGHGTLLAAAAKLAAFSEERGCPVGFRGLTGNLYLSHLLGLAALDPTELGLRWEGCLGPDGRRAPVFTLNIDPGLTEAMASYSRELRAAPSGDCGVRLCPHPLMGRVGELRRRTGEIPAAGDILSDQGLIFRAYHDDVSQIPVLGDLDGLQDFARQLRPKTFGDMTKLVGLCLSPGIQFQAERFAGRPRPFDGLTGTREDVYDICVEHGMDGESALRVMRQVCGAPGGLTPESRSALAGHGVPGVFLEVLDDADYLYPRGQCADYLYWALTLLRR